MKNKSIIKVTKIFTKIVEIFHWVGVALMAIATICSLTAPEWVNYFLGIEAKECCRSTSFLSRPNIQPATRPLLSEYFPQLSLSIRPILPQVE